MKKFISLSLMTFLVLPFAVEAQNVDINTRADIRANTGTERAELRLQNQAEFEARKEEIREKRAENRTEFKARIEAHKERFTANREEQKARLEAQAKARVESLLDRIGRHFSNIIDRFDSASARLEARIENFEERGVDVSESVELFAQAEAQLEITTDVVAQVEADIETELENEEISRDTIKALIDTAKESIKETKEAYVAVIASLRADVQLQDTSDDE